jgi:hypothetical protein
MYGKFRGNDNPYDTASRPNLRLFLSLIISVSSITKEVKMMCGQETKDQCAIDEYAKNNVCRTANGSCRNCNTPESNWKLDSHGYPYYATSSSVTYPVHININRAAYAS